MINLKLTNGQLQNLEDLINNQLIIRSMKKVKLEQGNLFGIKIDSEPFQTIPVLYKNLQIVNNHQKCVSPSQVEITDIEGNVRVVKSLNIYLYASVQVETFDGGFNGVPLFAISCEVLDESEKDDRLYKVNIL